jgi:hypothetical protein
MPSGAECPPDAPNKRRQKRTGQHKRACTDAWPSSHVCDLQGAAYGGMEAFLQVEAAQAGTVWEKKTKSKWRRSCFQVHAKGVPPGPHGPAAGVGWPPAAGVARASSTRPSVATLQRRWELCSMRCGSVSPSSWWMRRTLRKTRTRRKRSCTRSRAMRRARLSGGSCGTKTPLTLSGAALSTVTRTQRSTSTACWYAGRPTAPATFPGYLAEQRCKWWSGSAPCGDGGCHGRCSASAFAVQRFT